MSGDLLSDFVKATAAERGIPGVAIGVWGRRSGSPRVPRRDNVENPLPVDPDTLYVLGSVTKPPH